MSDQNKKQAENSRRQALKAITAASGGIVAAKWSKPIVDSVVLPGHAQTSLVSGSGGGSSSTSYSNPG